jgi:hypothetical protein
MHRLKLLGTLLTGSWLVIGTIATAEPVKDKPAVKEHPECKETKMKTACKHAEEVKDYLMSIQAPPTSGPTTGLDQTAVSNSRQVAQPAKDDSAGTQAPR